MIGNKNPSQYISEFLNFISQVQSGYADASEEMKQQDKLTQDYLHSLELGELNCKERSKIATRLAINRRDRRYFKDRVEEYKPIVDFFEDSKNREVLNKLKQVLGECRKQENYHKGRTYVPKAIKR